MTRIWFDAALILTLLASGGFIVFIVKQQRWVFRAATWIFFSGFLSHTVFLTCRYVELGAAPVLDLRSALSFFSWSIVLVYLVLQLRFRLMVLGSFVAPFAAFLLTLSSTIPWIDGPVRPVFQSIWLTVHIGTIFLGDALFAVAFLAAVMYLIQEHHIKSKNLGSFFKRLPSLATLDAVNHYAIAYGFPFLTLGMITGSVYAQVALGSYWQWDPKEVWSLITWLFYAALVHERLAAGWRGRRAAIMSIFCFGVLVFTFVGVSLWLGGYHSFSSLSGGKSP